MAKNRNKGKKKGTYPELKKPAQEEAIPKKPELIDEGDDAAPAKKKDLSFMSMDDFMSSALDFSSDEENEALSDSELANMEDAEEEEVTSEPEPEDSAEVSQVKGSISKHKAQLERLKEKDPSFYKFLQENESDLLNFGEDESDFDEEEEEEVGGSEGEEGAQEETEGDFGAEDEEEEEGPKKKVLTLQQLKQWTQTAQKEKSLKCMKNLVISFRCAATVSEQSTAATPFVINDAKVFDYVIQYGLRTLPKMLDAHLGRKFSADGSNTVDIHNRDAYKTLPTKSPKWNGQIEKIVRPLVSAVLRLLETMVDVSLLRLVLLQLHSLLLPYALCFNKLAPKYLKAFLRLWVNENETVRSLAYLCISKMAIALPYPFISSCFKGMYLTFVSHSKFTNQATQPLINFMMNSVVELYGLDLNTAYENAFVFIRQLAIHLRGAMQAKTQNAYQKVYNWQFVNSLRCWARVIAAYPTETGLRPLLYPLIQIAVGTLSLVPVVRYYPLRFHVLRLLNQLAFHADVFIPITPHLLEIFESPLFTKKSKPAVGRPYDFAVNLKAAKAVTNSKGFHDGVLDQSVSLLAHHLAQMAAHPAFPELVAPVMLRLTKFKKITPNVVARKKIQTLLSHVNTSVQMIKSRRLKAAESPQQMKKLRIYEDWEEMPLAKYHAALLQEEQAKLNPSLQQHEDLFSSSEMEAEDDEDELDEEEEEEEEEQEEEEEEEEEVKKPVKSSKRKGSKPTSAPAAKRSRSQPQGGEEDEVTEFRLDDF